MLMELGRLTFDVEVKPVGEGKKVLNNRLAIPAGKDKTTFVDVVAWDGTAELIGKYFKKGHEILIEGTLLNTKKRISEGVEIDNVSIRIDRVIFTHGNPKNEKDPLPDEAPDFLK